MLKRVPGEFVFGHGITQIAHKGTRRVALHLRSYDRRFEEAGSSGQSWRQPAAAGARTCTSGPSGSGWPRFAVIPYPERDRAGLPTCGASPALRCTDRSWRWSTSKGREIVAVVRVSDVRARLTRTAAHHRGRLRRGLLRPDRRRPALHHLGPHPGHLRLDALRCGGEPR